MRTKRLLERDQYFAYAKQNIGNLSFTYKPAGTMLKGSVVQLLLPRCGKLMHARDASPIPPLGHPLRCISERT